MTVIMNADFSAENFEKTEYEILETIQYEFLSAFNSSLKIKQRHLKKWRYSHADENHAEDFLPLSANENIILAGDGFGGGSLVGAVRSALAVDRHLRKVMNLPSSD